MAVRGIFRAALLFALISHAFFAAEAVPARRASEPSDSTGVFPRALSKDIFATPLDLQLWLTSSLLRTGLPNAQYPERSVESSADAAAAAALLETARTMGSQPVEATEYPGDLVIRPANGAQRSQEVRVRKHDWAITKDSLAWGERLGEAQRADFRKGGFSGTAEVLGKLYEDSSVARAAYHPDWKRGEDPQVNAWTGKYFLSGENSSKVQSYLLNRLRLLSRPSSQSAVKRRKLPKGASGGAIVTMPDGQEAVWKYYDQGGREAAAFRLSERTGYFRVPAAVEGVWNGYLGGFRHFVQGAYEVAPWHFAQSLDAWIFAYLSGNPDVGKAANTVWHDGAAAASAPGWARSLLGALGLLSEEVPGPKAPSPGAIEIQIDHNVAFDPEGETLATINRGPFLERIDAEMSTGKRLSPAFARRLDRMRPQDLEGLGGAVDPKRGAAAAERLRAIQDIFLPR